jgi:hypothetical protein
MGGDFEALGWEPQLSTIAMDAASVLKEHGHKKGTIGTFCGSPTIP